MADAPNASNKDATITLDDDDEENDSDYNEDQEE